MRHLIYGQDSNLIYCDAEFLCRANARISLLLGLCGMKFLVRCSLLWAGLLILGSGMVWGGKKGKKYLCYFPSKNSVYARKCRT